MPSVTIVEPAPAWPARFASLRDALLPTVGDFALAVEHVGSTAVPGLAAKPVIDLDVVVRLGDVAREIAALATLGYEHRGDLGIPGREAFSSPGDAPGARADHHLYLCPADSPALANHLGVRDLLRAEPELVHEYGELKRRLARRHPNDIDAYVEGKTAFLLAILRPLGVHSGRPG